MKNKTDITILLDRSGSMQTIRKDMMGAFKVFADDQRAIKHDECSLSLYQFDTEIEEKYKDLNIEQIPELELEPRGGTALYDALEHVINKTGERLAALPESEKPARVVFVVITDGGENSSKTATASKVKAMIQHQTDVYSWSFVYLGANQDAFEEGGKVGFGRGSTLNYQATADGVQCAYAAVSSSVANFRRGESKSVMFEQEHTEKH